jgi:hypothetical protein
VPEPLSDHITMNISRLNTAGGSNLDAANQIKRGMAPAEASAAADARAKQAEAALSAPTTPAVQGHPRLDAYAAKIEARLAHAIDNAKLSPRQQNALEQARKHFQGLMARLHDAFPEAASERPREIVSGLDNLLDYFAETVNHIQSGGNIDTTG